MSLPLFDRRPPVTDPLPILIRALDGRGWRTAKSLIAELGWSDRQIRAVASESKGLVISGQCGYRLTRQATDDECDRAEAWLLKQSREMTDRAREIRIARNQRHV